MARLILLLATSLANAARPAGHDGMPHARRLKAEWAGEATWQSRAIFAERRSPTTDMISFSPRTCTTAADSSQIAIQDRRGAI